MEMNASAHDAFVDLISSNQGIIQKIVRLYEDLPETRKDLEQEVMLQAWKSYAKFRGDAQFSTWLYKVALNTALTYRRKESRLPKADTLKESIVEKHADESTTEQSEKLWRAIKALDDIDKSIITMHLDGYKNEEIAATLGITVNHTGVKLHRIKQHLTKQLLKT